MDHVPLTRKTSYSFDDFALKRDLSGNFGLKRDSFDDIALKRDSSDNFPLKRKTPYLCRSLSQDVYNFNDDKAVGQSTVTHMMVVL